MASIECNTATLTKPALTSNAVRDACSKDSSSGLTSIHSPAAAFNFDSSLSAENRVSRAPKRRTQNSPPSSWLRGWSTAKTLQLVPGASEWVDLRVGLEGRG